GLLWHMADDITPTDATGATPDPSAAQAAGPEQPKAPASDAAGQQPPSTPEVPDFKDWTPEQFVEWKTQHEGELISKVRDELRDGQERRDAERRRSAEAQATAKSDMDWATELDKRLDSDDAEVRQAARAERDEHR